MHVFPCLFGELVMKRFFLSVVLVSSFSVSAFAQTAAAPAVTVPAKTAPPSAAAVNAVCKDGTPFSGATLKGACRGHGGVDKKAATASPSTTSALPVKPPASIMPSQAAAGGGAGQVWVNSSTKVYHCQGDRYYGKTKKGEYMSESDAQSKGFHGSRGKACAK